MIAVLDETDSGLDIDALREVAAGHRGGPQGPRRARHPAHHALPAHPRPPHARRRARAHRRPHRRDRATPSSPARVEAEGFDASGSGTAAMTSMSALDVAKIKRDFPLLEREVNGKRLTYLDSASSSQKPRRGARRDGRLLPRTTTPTSTAACTRSPRKRPPRTSTPGARSPRFVGRGVSVGDRVRPQRDRGDQPRRVHVGARQPARRRRRSCSRTWSTTPTSCRGTCSPPNAASSCAGSR